MQTHELSDDSKAILLLCGSFRGRDKQETVKPLSISEYNTIAGWLDSKDLRPENLLEPATITYLKSDLSLKIDTLRIGDLLKRGASLAFSVENWLNKGIWILTRNDDDYPSLLSKRLEKQKPPIIFGIGDRGLFNTDGLAIVGSRNVDKEAEEFTREIGRQCAMHNITVVSGGARGVDQVAVLSALDASGAAISVMADGMLKASVSSKYREAIIDQRLLLISTYNPEASFNVGNAMARNKYMYASSKFGLVISTDFKKGGTWAGATEELKRVNHIPVYVRIEGNNIPKGNSELLKLGASEFPERPWDSSLFDSLVRNNVQQESITEQTSIFETQHVQTKSGITELDNDEVKDESVTIGDVPKNANSIFMAVLPILMENLDNWVTIDQLLKRLDVRRVQLEDWLKQALKNGYIQKKFRPVRYKKTDINTNKIN